MAELITFIYSIAFTYLIPVVMGIGLLFLLFAVPMCIHYNYHYFLLHGKLLWSMHDDNENNCNKVNEMSSLTQPVGVLDVFVFLGIVELAGLMLAILWPLTVIIIFMILIIMLSALIFRGRHRKLQFKLKLQGFYND